MDPLVTISSMGKIMDLNEAASNTTGLSRSQMVGSNFYDYFTEPQKAKEVYQEVFAKGSVANSPLTLRHKNGKLTDVLFNGSVYKNGKGTVLGVVIVARDVTEQKRIATELTASKIHAEETTRIANKAKRKAESATLIAENAVKAKQQFLSNMSHEIRTPMNAIIGFTKVVLKTELTDKQKEYHNAIRTSGDALIVLINDILDLAKVDAGKMTFEKSPFKLSTSLSTMLHLFEPKIDEKNLRLIKLIDKNIPDILVGDHVRLHQIILNLISNAVKFTSEGGITLKAQMLSEDLEKVSIEFAISDTGIGIPEDQLDNIFENFQQATSGTSRLYGGTGLGLAIVKQLVEAQNGSIKVESKLNKGSTFRFVLDFDKTDLESVEVVESVEIDEAIKGSKILVVEDITLNQLLMKTLLEDFKFKCDIASNGKDAIEKLQNNAYDLILMDLQMPVMNGFEATDFIRNQMNSQIPIIALTADVTTMDKSNCESVGLNDYITKPVDENLLYHKILCCLKRAPCEPAEITESEKEKHADASCISLKYLERISKSNKDLMAEMISLYLAEADELVKAMKKSTIESDSKSLHLTAHKLVPLFATMGIDVKYENMAKQIMDYTRTNKNTEKIPELVLKLEYIFLRACEELTVELDLMKKAN